LFYAPCFRYTFKVAYLSDDREEHLHQVWIDGGSGREMSAYSQLGHIFYEASADVLLPELEAKPGAELLSAALTQLESLTSGRQDNLRTLNRQALAEETERTNAYFARMIEEHQSKIGKATAAGDRDQEKQLKSKLESVLLQKKHHVEDVAQKYQVRLEVALLDMVLYMVPRWRLSLALGNANRKGKAPVERILYFDQVLRKLVDGTDQSCHKLTADTFSQPA